MKRVLSHAVFFPAIGLSLAALACLAGGCQLLGVVANSASSGSTIKARYVPIKTDSMLIVVEAYGLEMDSGAETQRLTMSLSKQIRDNKIAPLVDQQRLERLKDADPDGYQKMTIAQIGQVLGARQILYVNATLCEIEKPIGGGQMRGKMRAAVKIVDSETANSRWPLDGSSEPIEIDTPWSMDDGSKTESDLRREMSDQMSEAIGNLFHDWHSDSSHDPIEKMGEQ